MDNSGILAVRNIPEIGLTKRSSGGAVKLHVVERVKELGSKLKLPPLLNSKLFQHRKIPVLQARAAIIRQKSTEIAERERRGVSESCVVEPAIDPLLRATRRLAFDARAVGPLITTVRTVSSCNPFPYRLRNFI